MTIVTITLFSKIFNQENNFAGRTVVVQVQYLGLVVEITLKFYNNVKNGLKLKVRKF